MKKYINKLLILGSLLFLGSSCDSEAELTTLKAVSFPSQVVASSNTIVLTEDNADDNAILISWPAVTFPIAAPVTYAIQFDLIGDTSGNNAWQKAKRIEDMHLRMHFIECVHGGFGKISRVDREPFA